MRENSFQKVSTTGFINTATYAEPKLFNLFDSTVSHPIMYIKHITVNKTIHVLQINKTTSLMNQQALA